MLTFAHGEACKTGTVRVNGDLLGEEDEGFTRLCRVRWGEVWLSERGW